MGDPNSGGSRRKAELALAKSPRSADGFDAERGRAQVELKWTLDQLEERVAERTLELRRANASLAASERRFRLLAENAPDVLYRFRLAPSPRFEYVSPSIVVLTGYTPEDFYQDPLLAIRLVHPEDQPFAQRQLTEPTVGEPTALRVFRKDADCRWMEYRCSGVYDANGELVAVDGIARDITERKQAEESLRAAYDNLEIQVRERTVHLRSTNEALTAEIARRQSVERELRKREASLRSILETAVDGIVSIDEHGLIESFNPAAERIFGYAAAEVVGQSFKMLMPPEYADKYEEIFRRHLETGDKRVLDYGREVVGRRRDGSLFPMDLGIGAMRGEPNRFTGVVRDVTAGRRLEEALRQSQKMQAIGTLASGVAHDFNNVLMGVIGCADLAISKLPGGSASRSYLDALKSAAYSGAEIVGQLMEASRPRTDKMRVVDVNTLLARRETLLGRLVREDVELRIVLGSRAAQVRSDPAHFDQMLMNLVVNARHAMPHGGRLTISTGDCSVQAYDASWYGKLGAGHYVTLTVQDTGIGMDEETRRRALEPFFTTKEPGRGTGLGLSIVYAIVTACGGHMEIQSQPNAGTTVTLYIPRTESMSDEEQDAEREPLSSGGESRGETVLVVEDEPLVRMAICHYLERHGYRVIETPTFEEAEKLLGDPSVPVDLLLTDVVLPHSGGWALSQLGRSRRSSLRVLFMSANSTERLIKEGRLEAGSVSIRKPFTESELLTMVRAALQPELELPPLSGAPPIFLPSRESVEEGQTEGSPSAVARHSPAREPCLLVVEDNDLARETLSELLEDDGYRVVSTGSGSEALRAWDEQRGRFDAVLSDMNLPDMSGLALVSRVRERQPHVALVVMTGRPVSEAPFDVLRDSPRTLLLEKPIDMMRLAERLRKLLENEPSPE